MKKWFAVAAKDGARRVPAIFYAGTLVLAGAATDGLGDEAKDAKGRDQSKYTLFKPTPRDGMRELTTDRPDKTESPFTVDAGVDMGLTRAADDLNPFMGISWRS